MLSGISDTFSRTVASFCLCALTSYALAQTLEPALDNRAVDDCSTSIRVGNSSDSRVLQSSPNGTIWPWQTFVSANYTPPQLSITGNGGALAQGLLFFGPSNSGPSNSIKEYAPLIMTDAGQLVWNGPIVNSTNLRATTFEGRPVLTYWDGISTQGANIGHGYGKVTFLDQSYSQLYVVCPDLGLVTPDNISYDCTLDLHESYVTDRDTILVTAYNATPADLTSVGGPAHGWSYDCLFFEVDPKTDKILFRWSAQEHVLFSLTKRPLDGTGGNQSAPFDWFHINSVTNIGADQFLVNSRHTFSTWLLDAQGNIIWHVEGDNGGDWGQLPDNGHFAWQHEARLRAQGNDSMTISWFNNFNSEVDNQTDHPTTGLEMILPMPPDKSKSPVVVYDLTDPARAEYADSQGSYDPLGNGNQFMQYGQIPILREYDPDGTVLWEGRFGPDNIVQSYRGYKQEWHATPSYPPSLAVRRTSECEVTAYVSWNGATDVTGWAVYGAHGHNGQLTRIGVAAAQGFETAIGISGEVRGVEVAPVVNGTESKLRSALVYCE